MDVNLGQVVIMIAVSVVSIVVYSLISPNKKMDIGEILKTMTMMSNEITRLREFVNDLTITIVRMQERMTAHKVPTDDIPIPKMEPATDNISVQISKISGSVNLGDIVGKGKTTAGNDINSAEGDQTNAGRDIKRRGL